MIKGISIESIDLADSTDAAGGIYFGSVTFRIQYDSSFVGLTVPFQAAGTLDDALKAALTSLQTFGAELQEQAGHLAGE